MEPISILITDDHKLVREAWTTILNNDPRFNVIAEAGSAEEALELARTLRPRIVIMDINLPGMNGIEVIPMIRKYSPGTRILGVSLHTQPTYARRMIQQGAHGYVTKSSSREEMFNALLQINQSKTYLCEEIKNIISEQMINGEENTGINNLSPRELEIIRFIRDGFSSREIAEQLYLAVKTVEVHRYNILRKLNLKNAAALVNYINAQPEFC